MRILIITAPSEWPGQWGRRIAEHVQSSAPPDWQIVGPPEWPALARLGPGANALSIMLDDPVDILPENLPQAGLLLVLTESPAMTDLVSDLAGLCGAQAVIVAVDKQSWAPPGLAGQVRRRLHAMGISSAWPMPFCALAPKPGQHPLIQEFARRYGRPELTCEIQNDAIAACRIVRETPCGNTRYIVSRLIGSATDQSVEQCGLLHHYYPCWGGMETDPVHGTHTLLHIAATIAQKSLQRAIKNAAAVRDPELKGKTRDDPPRAPIPARPNCAGQAAPKRYPGARAQTRCSGGAHRRDG